MAVITGDDGANRLVDRDSDDILRAGNDALTGGLGDDSFVFGPQAI